jgi:hypothetical protein
MTKLSVAFGSYAKETENCIYTYRYYRLISSLPANEINDNQRICLSFDSLIIFKVTYSTDGYSY